MSYALRALVGGACAAALLGGGGCVFMPSPDDYPTEREIAASPDASAQRLPQLETRHFELADSEQDVVGGVQVLFARYENTFVAIAREYDLGYEELRAANPTVDQWLPGEGTPVYLPTQFVLPDAPRDGIVLNLPSMRLMYFARRPAQEDGPVNETVQVVSHPIGIGRQGWATPTGKATVTSRARDPAWYVPASVRAEHAERGDPLPHVVPPGPDNPLGKYALALSMPGYLIHGTNKPAGVGMRVSHGCIRLYPEDIEELFQRVPDDTPVYIVDQPVLAGWRDGVLYLEVHSPLAEDERDLGEEAHRVLADALARAGREEQVIDEQAVSEIVAQRRGIAFPVSNGVSPERYLAAARVIRNSTPLPVSESTARAD
jgi:L,D-transpeptidase ErfK/SrfK